MKDGYSATRIGLHTTQEELYCWRQRAQIDSQGANGITCPVKYRTTGDVSTNSPGDWTIIIGRGATLNATPLEDNWQGQTAAGVWAPDGHTCTYTQGTGQGAGCVPFFEQGLDIAAAGFATLVDPAGHNYSAAVRTALLAQIAYTGTDWTNTAKWPNQQLGDGYSHQIATWLTRMAFAYDYVRASSQSSVFSSGEKTSIETWFSNAAFYWARNTDFLVRSSGFGNRNTEFDTTVNVSGTYTTNSFGSNPDAGGQGYITHYDCANTTRGHLAGSSSETWNNRSSSQIRFAAVGAHLNGTLTNDAQTKRWVRMWFKEWITYAVFDDGMVNDYKRWHDGWPQQGWTYGGLVIGAMATTADVFARAGDTSLYDFSTSAGFTWSANPSGYNANTTGGPKTLLAVIQRHASFVPQRSTGVPNWNGRDTTASGGALCGNVIHLLQPVDDILHPPPTTVGKVNDTYYAHANLYYRDSTVQSHYTRTSTGAPAYPQATDAPDGNWGGEWGVYPGVLFMFGQMENETEIDPFGSTSGTPAVPVITRVTR